MATKMSLHRVIAEIKSLETKLETVTQTPFVFLQQGETDEANIRNYKGQSQSAYDKIQSNVSNLATLKSARNKANSTVVVNIAGKQMTIDEALANKAALPHKQNLVNTLQAQFNNAQKNVDNAQAQIEQKINQQLATMFTGTRKAIQEEMDIVRGSFERTAKPSLIFADGLKERLEGLKKEIEDFNTEVDYVLSEANATNVVEVALV